MANAVSMKQLAAMVDVFLMHIVAMERTIVVTTVMKVVDVSLGFFSKISFLKLILSINLAQGAGGKRIFSLLYVRGR